MIGVDRWVERGDVDPRYTAHSLHQGRGDLLHQGRDLLLAAATAIAVELLAGPAGCWSCYLCFRIFIISESQRSLEFVVSS